MPVCLVNWISWCIEYLPRRGSLVLPSSPNPSYLLSMPNHFQYSASRIWCVLLYDDGDSVGEWWETLLYWSRVCMFYSVKVCWCCRCHEMGIFPVTQYKSNALNEFSCYLSVCLSFGLSDCLSVCLSVGLFVPLFVYIWSIKKSTIDVNYETTVVHN